MIPQPKMFTRKETVEKKKLLWPKRLLMLGLAIWFLLGTLFIVSAIKNFIDTHNFQSPIVFQNPIPLKRVDIKNPVGSKSAGLIQRVEAAEKPYSVDQDIKDVFGQYSDKAFLLLTCENSTHDPLRTNTYGNSPAGSTDWGVFMINDHWQGVTNKAFLTDPRINIRMAYNIFSRDGYSFKLWTCGRKYGI